MIDEHVSHMSADDWLRRLRSWGVRPSKSKGQNFLLDPAIVNRIADAAMIAPGDLVIEIGPGMGILSSELLERGARVKAIELDDTLAPRLEQHFSKDAGFTLIHADASAVNPEGITGHQPYKIVANLPYGVATMIVRHYLESTHPPSQLTIMVQKEVAERMAADTGEMSLLTLAVQIFTVPAVLFDVPEEAFHPAPKVKSSVIQLDVRDTPLLEAEMRTRLFAIATVAFQQRRKTLLNSLSRGLSLDKPAVTEELTRLDVDPASRPQAVSIDLWLRLASSPVLKP